MIDEIYKLYSNYIFKYGGNENDFNFYVFTDLIKYIQAGKYTERRNKKIILDHWMTHSNRELSDFLRVTVSSISYAKKDICLDLKQSLGGTLISLVKNKQFEEINQLLMLESDYQHYETLLPNCLTKKIDVLYNSEITNQEDWKQKLLLADKKMTEILSDEPSIKLEETHQLLHFIQRHFSPRADSMMRYFDIYQLKLIVDILEGNHGTAEMRHNLIKYLRDSPSRFEDDLAMFDMERVLNNINKFH